MPTSDPYTRQVTLTVAGKVIFMKQITNVFFFAVILLMFFSNLICLRCKTIELEQVAFVCKGLDDRCNVFLRLSAIFFGLHLQ